jgi:3-hydroxyacyl-[acyl-carrier-protein] dehydratase
MTTPMHDIEAETAPRSQRGKSADINEIMGLIPHRYPFLLIDRLEDIQPRISAVGIKNVTYNEPFFQGHFPGHPVMPGVLIIEALAQTAAGLVMYTLGGRKNEVVYFMSIDNARFRVPVVPGDTLRLVAKVSRNRGAVWRFLGEAFVGDRLVAEAEYSAMIVNASE